MHQPAETIFTLEIFARILYLRIALKDIFVMLKIRDYIKIYLISRRQHDLATSRGSRFHETSHSFAKIKSLQKFQNLQ